MSPSTIRKSKNAQSGEMAEELDSRNSKNWITEHRRKNLRGVGWRLPSGVWSPPTDFYETEEAYFVRVEIAGMREEDFEVSFEKNTLSISGSRPAPTERRAYHQMEIRSGWFDSAVLLPTLVDTEKAEAEYKDGFLVVILPKYKPHSVKVLPGDNLPESRMPGTPTTEPPEPKKKKRKKH